MIKPLAKAAELQGTVSLRFTKQRACVHTKLRCVDVSLTSVVLKDGHRQAQPLSRKHRLELAQSIPIAICTVGATKSPLHEVNAQLRE